MRCFEHSDAEAVGICQVCGRGICRACAADLGRALACQTRCAEEMRRLLDLRDFGFMQPQTQASLLAQGRRAYLWVGPFLLSIGGILIALRLVYPNPRLQFTIYLGIAMALFGLVNLLASRKMPQTKQFRLCPRCGYNLTGNTTGRCPECGHIT